MDGEMMLKVQQNNDVDAFCQKITDFIQIRSFLAIYEFVLKSGVYPTTDKKSWFNTLAYMHVKGWLYVDTTDGAISAVVGAYRVKDIGDFKVLPENEEGDILFVPFAATKGDNNLVLKQMLDKYTAVNPDVKEMVFFEQNKDDRFRRFKLKEN